MLKEIFNDSKFEMETTPQASTVTAVSTKYKNASYSPVRLVFTHATVFCFMFDHGIYIFFPFLKCLPAASVTSDNGNLNDFEAFSQPEMEVRFWSRSIVNNISDIN